MNTGTGDSPRLSGTSGIASRKADHLSICADTTRFPVESAEGAWFENIRFVHTALPELHCDDLDPTASFLGAKLSFPFLISSMTGGSREALQFNRELARAAGETGVAVGLGSIRIVFERPETMDDFRIVPFASGMPVFANLSAVQLRDLETARICDVLEELEVSALAVHLNPGQELMQKDGDRDFRGLLDCIRRFMDDTDVPVIVKETGFGIRPALGLQLADAGAAFIDVAGGGGTNWLLVDSLRKDGGDPELAEPFREWGLPTAALVAAYNRRCDSLIASGGLRSGLDLAKAIALGAAFGATALPFVAPVLGGGTAAAVELINRYRRQYLAVMLLTGCKDNAALAGAPLILDEKFSSFVRQLSALEGADNG